MPALTQWRQNLPSEGVATSRRHPCPSFGLPLDVLAPAESFRVVVSQIVRRGTFPLAIAGGLTEATPMGLGSKLSNRSFRLRGIHPENSSQRNLPAAIKRPNTINGRTPCPYLFSALRLIWESTWGSTGPATASCSSSTRQEEPGSKRYVGPT